MRIDIVADMVCPWCFIGKRRLERAIAMRPDLAVDCVWHPFQLNPDLPPEGLPYELYLRAKFGNGRAAARTLQALVAAGEREGIVFAFERIRRIRSTLDAHRVVRLAATAGCADAVVEALFRGYFCDGVDIGDIDTLAAFAAAAGLDRAAARDHLGGGAGIAEVRAAEQRARRGGIDAVPSFIVGGVYGLAGAQDSEMFLPLFDLAVAAATCPPPDRRDRRASA
jgi:predicted DsbA family dithiol-disulfide isomerase